VAATPPAPTVAIERGSPVGRSRRGDGMTAGPSAPLPGVAPWSVGRPCSVVWPPRAAPAGPAGPGGRLRQVTALRPARVRSARIRGTRGWSVRRHRPDKSSPTVGARDFAASGADGSYPAFPPSPAVGATRLPRRARTPARVSCAGAGATDPRAGGGPLSPLPFGSDAAGGSRPRILYTDRTAVAGRVALCRGPSDGRPGRTVRAHPARHLHRQDGREGGAGVGRRGHVMAGVRHDDGSPDRPHTAARPRWPVAGPAHPPGGDDGGIAPGDWAGGVR
jgi:hypothetical protein